MPTLLFCFFFVLFFFQVKAWRSQTTSQTAKWYAPLIRTLRNPICPIWRIHEADLGSFLSMFEKVANTEFSNVCVRQPKKFLWCPALDLATHMCQSMPVCRQTAPGPARPPLHDATWSAGRAAETRPPPVYWGTPHGPPSSWQRKHRLTTPTPANWQTQRGMNKMQTILWLTWFSNVRWDRQIQILYSW